MEDTDKAAYTFVNKQHKDRRAEWSIRIFGGGGLEHIVQHDKGACSLMLFAFPEVEMTTYIPSLTLPQQVFASPAAAILLPVTIGAAVGFGVSRESQ